MNSYPIKTPQQLGAVLQGFRKAYQLTQAQVGARVGLAQKEISKLEMHPSNTSLARVFKVLAALQLELVAREHETTGRTSEWQAMGRVRKSRALSVWINGEHVGEWRRSSSGGQEFAYAQSWLASSSVRPISLSLPLRPHLDP